VLSGEEIEANFKTYKKQAEKIVDFSRVRVVYNSTWLSSLTFTDIVKLCQHFSFGDFASRELIAKRLKNKQHVGLHEALYPVMQGYDMYHLNADIQIGGTDQTFNMQAGRHLQRKLHNKETFVIATEFLPGTDGKKMSKTGGNAIWLSDPARDMYRKIMAIDDSQIPAYASLGTNMSSDETRALLSAYQANTLHPMDAKKMLAHRLVSELHDSTQADDAADFFQASVQQKTVSIGEIREVTIDSDEASIPLAQFLTQTGAVHTISQAKDLIKQGSVQINGTALRYPNMHMSEIINDLPSVLLRVNRTLSLRIVIK
jgi:tyrosyl-tRNA synthetase